ncbi:pyridoxamine 5'-phosphate oxidase family protein [Epidermidibacterium keratini]
MSPTDRTALGRHSERGKAERRELYDVLDAGVICHIGLLMNGAPRVLPTAYGFDPDGPDQGGTLYLHGSVAATSLRAAPEQEMCATITHLDGLVLARSAFNSSMNYRSAVIIGRPRLVTDPAEVTLGLERVVDQVCPGRWAALRDSTRKELAATAVLALPLHEASVKVRDAEAGDDASDVEANAVWAGVIPVSVQYGAPVANSDCDLPVPDHVQARVS